MQKQPTFLKDLEVREIQSLDHAKLANAVVHGITLSATPCRLGLFGPWGSGKTTILKLVESQLATMSEDEAQPFVRSFWFNAWEYESSTNLFHSLVLMLVQEIPDGVRFSRKGSAVVGRVLDSSRVHGRRFSDRTHHLREEANTFDLDAVRSDFERLIEMLLVAGGRGRLKRLVVFVDDVDKCLPLNGLALLESIKLFFGSAAPVVFLCSVDPDVLHQIVMSKYQRAGTRSDIEFAESYIDKIFEFSFIVPTVQTVQFQGLVEEIYKRSGLADRKGSANWREEAAVIERVFSRPGLSLNPRKIKRIFNRFLLFLCHEPPLEPEAITDPERLDPWLTWLLAIDHWRDLRAYVQEYHEVALRELGNRIVGNPVFPHSNDGAKRDLGKITEVHTLIDFLRQSLAFSDDSHLPEAQTEMRKAILQLGAIHDVLSSHGL